MANYNNGNYIQEAIESVIHQNFSDWELLIMDDGSTDDSISRINAYLNDKRITLIRHSFNKGKVLSLIELVDQSKSSILGVLDSDDALSKDALSVMYAKHIKHDDCGFIYSQFIFCDNNLDSICEGFCRSIPKGETNLRSIYSSAFRTYKKDYYMMTEGYNENFIYGQDRDIVFKMEEVTKLLFVEKVLYKHRVLSNSISNDPRKKMLGHFLLIKAKYDAFCRRSESQIPNLTKKEMSIELCIASIICFRLYRRNDCLDCFKSAIDLNYLLLISMINYLIKKTFKKLGHLFRPSAVGTEFRYTKVNKEIQKQLRAA